MKYLHKICLECTTTHLQRVYVAVHLKQYPGQLV